MVGGQFWVWLSQALGALQSRRHWQRGGAARRMCLPTRYLMTALRSPLDAVRWRALSAGFELR